MISLIPRQYVELVRRLRRYLLLLGSLQGLLLLAILAEELLTDRIPHRLRVFGYVFRPWELWLLQAMVLATAALWIWRFAVRVVCPQCLGSLARFRQHRVYYCPACDEYTDDGTMERLSQQPLAAPPALHQKGREWNRMNCLARIGGPETFQSTNKAFPVSPGPGPCSR